MYADEDEYLYPNLEDLAPSCSRPKELTSFLSRLAALKIVAPQTMVQTVLADKVSVTGNRKGLSLTRWPIAAPPHATLLSYRRGMHRNPVHFWQRVFLALLVEVVVLRRTKTTGAGR